MCSFDVFLLRRPLDAEETTQRLHPPNRQSASCEISPPAGENLESRPLLSVFASCRSQTQTLLCFPAGVPRPEP